MKARSSAFEMQAAQALQGWDVALLDDIYDV